MAHEIDMSNNRANLAFVGSRSAVWHGLGQELTVGAPIEDWIVEAGLAWEAFESAVSFDTMDGKKFYPDKRVLFRSDTMTPLSIVGKDYKLVQPAEVLEFFRDLTTLHGMSLSSAGSLFGGKRFWALAETGKTVEAVKNDPTNGYILLTTSLDGTMATSARHTSVRVVCNNTLTAAMKGQSKNVIKRSHRAEWDPQSVKLDMGLVDESWEKFSAALKNLATVEVTDKYVREYVQSKVYMPGVPVEDQPVGRVKEANRLLDAYQFGAGSNFSKGTAYGVLQAFTDVNTHGTGKRDQSVQFLNSYFGRAENTKNEVFADMMALMA